MKSGDSVSSIANSAFGPYYHSQQLQQQIDHICEANRAIIHKPNLIFPGQLLYICKTQTLLKSEALLSQDIWETNLLWNSLSFMQQQYIQEHWNAIEALWCSLTDPINFLSGISEKQVIEKLYEYISQMKPPPPDLIMEVRSVINRRLWEIIDSSYRDGWILLRATRVRMTNKIFIIFEDSVATAKYHSKLVIFKQLGQALNWIAPRTLPVEVGLAVGTVLSQNSEANRRRAVFTEGFGLSGSFLAMQAVLKYGPQVCRMGLGAYLPTRALAMTGFCEGFAATIAMLITAGAVGNAAGRKAGRELHKVIRPND